MLDTGSTINMSCNPNINGEIRTVGHSIEMQTNNGSSFHNQQQDMPGYGPAWFNKNGVANIFAMKTMEQKYRIVMDTAIENAFLIKDKKTDELVCKFSADERGLYTIEIPDSMLKKKEHNMMLDTIKENATGFTHKQVERAKRAHALYHNLNAPDYYKFKKIIQFNMIKNCPVTEKDSQLAESIYGRDVATIKRRARRTTPKQVKDDIIDIPRELYVNNKRPDLMY